MPCYNCAKNAETDLPPRDELLCTAYWRVGHAFDTNLPGWLVLAPREHVEAFTDLPREAVTELGGLVHDLSGALAEVTGCVKTYLMQFSEAEGFSHLHVHLVPRMPDQPAQARGPRVFTHLGLPEGERLSEDERDRTALAVRRALPALG